jgi:hypothetical protein
VYCSDGNYPDTTCTGPYSPDGQDGKVRVNVPTYTVASGPPETVMDSVTGLLWVRDAAKVLPSAAEATCTALGGSWHLPTVMQLVSIIDFGLAKPVIGPPFKPAFMSGTGSEPFLSATKSATGRYVVDFAEGWIDVVAPNSPNPVWVRCVKGELAGKLVFAPGCPVVNDARTGLTWQRVEQPPREWPAALSYCNTLALFGQTGWRLPNAKELQTIALLDGTGTPAIDVAAFPGTSPVRFWTSTPRPNASSWGISVDFADGRPKTDPLLTAKLNVRCVRGGQ